MSAGKIEDVYSIIGMTLCYMQSVENTFRFITTYVLQSDGELTIEKLNSLNKKESKKALGYFVGLIKKRADVLPELEALMADFLQNRNDFVHNHDKIKGWDLNTHDGRKTAKLFMSKLLRQGHKLNEILVALVCRWQEQTGIYPKKADGADSIISQIDSKYGAFVDQMFTEKT